MLEAWAARLALADAGLSREEMDGAVHAISGSPHPPVQWTDTYSRTLGLRPNIYLTIARGGLAAHNGILLATQLLNLGIATYAIVSLGLPSWSAAHSGKDKHDNVVGLSTWGQLDFGLGVLGFTAGASAATTHGFLASRHMHQYGTTAEHLGAVALSSRAWANLNPEARFYDRPATMTDYLNSPFVVEPLRRMDCCLQSDLGAALVITTADRALALKHKPVYIKGIGLGDQGREQWWNKTNYVQVDAAFASRQALSMAGIGIDEVDVAEVYDCFTIEVIFYLEDYGWCQKGEGGPFVASGATLPGGSIPLNTHGGHLSSMYLFDFPTIIEAVRQMRGEAGPRQVPGAEIALTGGHGGEMLSPFICCAHATMILGSERS